MARTSRKKLLVSPGASQKSTKYNVGAYIRISKEDNQVDSSIINQEDIIKEYLNKNSEMQIFKIYVDNGVSSFSSVRKAFNELIADVDAGNINCVIVKDLSRFGRDYIESGYYIENIFPLKSVRFIAILDNYDSYNLRSANETISMAIKSVMNMQYSKDISTKVKSVVMNKMEKGCYIPAFLPYGHNKRYENKTFKYAVDDEVSDVVKKIFELACNKTRSFDIASILNQDGILSPGAYKHKKGIKKKSNLTKWSKYTVDRIIKDRTYIGEMICNKTNNSLIRRGIKRLEKSNWIIIKDHHEPIISVDMFNMAQELFAQGKQATIKSKPRNSLEYYQKDLFCGDCGRKMKKRIWKGKTYFICPRYEEAKNLCSIKSVRDDILKSKIYEHVKQHNDPKNHACNQFSVQTDLSPEMYAYFVEKVYVYNNDIELNFKRNARDVVL